MVRAIIFLNVMVYFAWGFLGESDFMINNFLVSWEGLMEGRYWTLITSVFSHTMFFHIFLNMYVLLGFGSVMEKTLGPLIFLRFYLVAGIISSLSHSVVSTVLLNQPGLPALGASGSIAGVIVLFSLFYPKEKIYLLGFIPMPAIFGAFVFIGLDIWGLISQTQGSELPIGHGAHLGGSFTGFVYFLLLRNRLRARRRFDPA
jgi:membrane associated rhomboid family serine protease